MTEEVERVENSTEMKVLLLLLLLLLLPLRFQQTLKVFEFFPPQWKKITNSKVTGTFFLMCLFDSPPQHPAFSNIDCSMQDQIVIRRQVMGTEKKNDLMSRNVSDN